MHRRIVDRPDLPDLEPAVVLLDRAPVRRGRPGDEAVRAPLAEQDRPPPPAGSAGSPSAPARSRRPARRSGVAIAVWQPMASTVTTQPCQRQRSAARPGSPVISFEPGRPPPPGRGPGGSPGPGADQRQRGLAVGRGRGSGAASCHRWPPPPALSRATAATQERKPASNCAGSSAAKTRPKVSCEGMPLGSARKVRQPVALGLAERCDLDPGVGPTDDRAHRDGDNSSNAWRLVRSTRGSSSAAKWSSRRAVGASDIGAPHRSVASTRRPASRTAPCLSTCDKNVCLRGTHPRPGAVARGGNRCVLPYQPPARRGAASWRLHSEPGATVFGPWRAYAQDEAGTPAALSGPIRSATRTEFVAQLEEEMGYTDAATPGGSFIDSNVNDIQTIHPMLAENLRLSGAAGLMMMDSSEAISEPASPLQPASRIPGRSLRMV